MAVLAGAMGLWARGAWAQAATTAPTTASRTRPAGRSIPRPAARLRDRDVNAAIDGGLAFLFKIQKPDGTWATRYSRAHEGGFEALVALFSPGGLRF